MSAATKQQVKVPELRFPEFSQETMTSKKVIDTAPLQRGFDLTTSNVVKGEVPVVYSNGILRNHNVKQVSGPGVVTGRSGTIGKVFYIEQDFWPHNTTLWVTNFNGNHPKYIYYLYTTLRLERFNAGSTVPTLNRNDVHSRHVLIPSPQEQQKIADFLGSVDAWLDNLRSQKTALETYKRGMMQKLFTQQVRFKDDNGNDFPEWEEKELGSVFKAVKGTGLSKESLDKDGTNECILYGELYTTYSEVITEIKSKTNITEGALSKKGDLLIPSSTTTTAIDLANVTALNKEGVLLGGDITVLRGVDEVSNVFYAYYLSNHKKIELAKYGQGVTIIHIYYSHIKDMLIDVPTLPEQQKIADFLTAIDHTITAKAAEITQVEQWKKGLMQKMFI